jgi:YD repeat-containing protein
MTQETQRQSGRLITALLLLVLTAISIHAQGTSRYVYDDNGRLRAVIAPNGEANVYEYDPAGNITAIRRNAATVLEVLDFFPREGGPGTLVTIVGSGFGAGVNSVAFNGTAATITTSTSQIVATVPAGATTGVITVMTPNGTATTNAPFTVRGINVTPMTVSVLAQNTVQFAAVPISPDDQQVVWSVDGLEGGNTTVGTITTTGRYLAPKLPDTVPIANFRIRATSVNDASIAGGAVVTVRNPEFFRAVYSNAVMVTKTANNSLFSPLVSIGFSKTNALTSPAVAVTTAPVISSVTPGQVARAVAVTLIVNGANLNGATAIGFFDAASGNVTNDLSVANISVAADGKSLTATVTVTSGAALGRRFMVITAGGRTSPLGNSGNNVIEVIP